MKKFHVLGLALAVMMAAPVLAQDNPEGNWGAVFGNSDGTGLTSTLPIIFEPGDDIEIAWEFDAHGTWGMNGLMGRQQITFDAAGNLYWASDSYWWADHTRIVSLDPDGNLRWTYAGVDGLGLGNKITGRQTPIIGADALYCMSQKIEVLDDSDPPVAIADSWYVYAVNKTDGSTIWATQLDNEPTFKDGCCWKPQMVLKNGKIYHIGVPDDANGGARAIYVIDAATGTILQNTKITTLPTGGVAETNTVIVEDVFGPGVHGLYGTWESEVWCVKVDTVTPANTTLGWSAPIGGTPWYVEKHTMYSADLDLILSYALNDALGYEAFALDPELGDTFLGWGDADTDGDSGYFQSGALGPFDGSSQKMYTGGPDGKILQYDVQSTGIAYDNAISFSSSWGAMGNYMQLIPDSVSGDMYVSISGAAAPSHIALINLDGDLTKAPEGPAYIDNVKIYGGADANSLSLLWSEDFEGMSLGVLAGQGAWLDSSEASETGPSEVIVDPTDAGNQVVEVSPTIGAGLWEGIRIPLTLATYNVYRVEYDQYLSNNTQYLFMALGEDPDALAGEPYSVGWDATTKMYAIDFANTWDAETLLAEKTWESVQVTHDYVGEESTIVLGGTKTDVASWYNADTGLLEGWAPTLTPTGFGFQVADTEANSNVPTAVVVDYNFGNAELAYLDQQISGGPFVGPDGKIYFGCNDDNYFGSEPRAGTIYALQPVSDTLCGDSNCDGAVNTFDIDAFVTAIVAPATWSATYSCDFMTANDTNGDSAVNTFDIDTFVAAVINGACQ